MRKHFKPARIKTGSALPLGLIMLSGLGLPIAGYADDTPPIAPAPASTPNAVPAAGTSQLREVTVTAERRTENLQQTPIAVTQFSPETLQANNIESLRNLGPSTPGLYIPKSSINPGTSAFFIRGIGAASPTDASDVGVYIDGVFLPRGLGSNFEFTDIESIEVLRGPQGTLYGRNTSAGAIKINSADPTPELHFYQENGIGNYGEFVNRSGFNTPITDGVAASFDYVHKQRDGTLHDNYTNNDSRDYDVNAVRGKLKFTFSPDLDLVLAVRGTNDESTGGSQGSSVYVPGGLLATHGLLTAQQYANNPYERQTEIPNNYNNLVSTATSATLNWRITPNLNLKSITSFQEQRQPGYYDNDGTPYVLNEIAVHHRDHTTQQEFDLSGDYDQLHYVSGLYAYHETNNPNRIQYTATPTAGQTLTDGNVTGVGSFSHDRINSEAAFGHVTYNITDQLDGQLGGRYTFEHHYFNFTGTTYTFAPINGVNQDSIASKAITYNTGAQHSFDSFTPEIGLSYKFTPDVLGYVKYSQGYRAGGYNTQPAINATAALLAAQKAGAILPSQIAFAPETVDSYELGTKLEFLDKRERLNIALFYNEFQHYQGTVTIPFNNATTTTTEDAGNAVTEGLEVESTSLVTPDLTWRNNASYLYAVFTSQTSGAGGVTSGVLGERLPYAPRVQLETGLDWVLPKPVSDFLPLADVGAYTFGGDITYQSKLYTTIGNNAQVAVGTPGTTGTNGDAAAAQGNINLSLGYTSNDGHWNASINVNNLLNTTFAEGGGQTGGSGTTAYRTMNFTDPRFVLFRLRYSY